jgi:hypothetical protein
MAVQTMRSATYVQPGEQRTCVGCHEPRQAAPPNRAGRALSREPSEIALGPEGSWPLHFETLVQPVLARRCVSCHEPGAEGGQFDLTAEKSYDALVNFGEPSLKTHVMSRYRQGFSTAGACAAKMNPLVKLLDAGHYDVDLSEDGWNRLITWLDTYGQRHGSFDANQDDRLRELRRRMTAIQTAGIQELP